MTKSKKPNKNTGLLLSHALQADELSKLIFGKPIKRIIKDLRKSIQRAFKPTFYEWIGPRGKRIFNISEALWSFLMLPIPFMLIIISAFGLLALHENNFSVEKLGLVVALMGVSVLLASASISNGLRALDRNKKLQ